MNKIVPKYIIKSLYVSYIGAKIYGLAPFYITKDYTKAKTSRLSSIHSAIFGILMAICLIFEGIAIGTIDEIKGLPHGTVVEFVLYTQIWVNIYSTIILSFILFMNRTHIVNVINENNEMWSLLEKLGPITCFTDSDFYRNLYYQLFLSLVQFLGISVSIYSMSFIFENKISTLLMQIYWYSVFATNLMVGSYYFSCNIFFVWQFFRTINENLMKICGEIESLSSSGDLIKHKKLSNDIDQIRYLYTKTILILQRIIRIYVFALIVAILLTLNDLIGAVSEENFCLLSIWFFYFIFMFLKLFSIYHSVVLSLGSEYTWGSAEIATFGLLFYYIAQSFNIIWMSSLTIKEVRYMHITPKIQIGKKIGGRGEEFCWRGL